jgi:Jacalin-like lectin domain
MSVNLYYCGCSGGTGGNLSMYHNPNFESVISSEDCRISEVIIHSGNVIDSIAVSYVDSNDNPLGTFKLGGNGGNMGVVQIKKNGYIKGIYGAFDDVVGWLQINITDPAIGYAFGLGYHTEFEYFAPAGYLIIGFWGAAGDYIDRLGVILRKIPEEQLIARTVPNFLINKQ